MPHELGAAVHRPQHLGGSMGVHMLEWINDPGAAWVEGGNQRRLPDAPWTPEQHVMPVPNKIAESREQVLAPDQHVRCPALTSVGSLANTCRHGSSPFLVSGAHSRTCVFRRPCVWATSPAYA